MRLVRNSVLFVLWIASFSAGGAHAQDAVHVRIDTNFPEAVLYADSVLLGSVTNEPVAVPARGQLLRLAAPDGNSWSIPPVTKRLDAEAGDTVDLALHFPYYYRIESVPFGADVMIERDQDRHELGETPLLYRSNVPLSGILVVKHDGYAVERREPGKEVWNRHVVSLSPSEDLDPTAALVSWEPPTRHRVWIDYAALGTALAAGALAVHYKFRADDLYAEYEEAGDPRLRNRIHQFDTRAGVAFGAMQFGVGVFAIRLALR